MADPFVVTVAETEVPNDWDSPPDWREREKALDTSRSLIVEAPAGSGKTGLLIQRYLKLLGDDSVTEPEQVLAITFTKKATAEIRERVVEQLDAAFHGGPLKRGDAFERATRALAQRALERDRIGGWGLREDPRRLNVRTIDSVSAQIASSLPVLSGGRGQQTPVTDATRLYHAAARRTLMLFGGDDPVLNAALRTVLLHRDGNLKDCEALLTEMLGLRDQWGELIPLQERELDDGYLDCTVLPQLQRALELAVRAGLTRLAEVMPVEFLMELSALAALLAEGEPYRRDDNPLSVCAGRGAPGYEGPEALEHWRALIHLMVAPSSKTWRKGFAKNHLGFETSPLQKKRMKALLEQISHRDDLLVEIKRVDKLPPPFYPEEQWEVTKALFRLLSRALVELQFVFAERLECDFTEVGLRAIDALRTEDGVTDLEMALGMKVQHLLVDEMQDTSTRQYELIERLTQSWDGHSQTVFLVGDPKQSIYIFRQARVERFVRTMREQRLGEMRIDSIRLTANFRSQGGLVEAFNQDFSLLFSGRGGSDSEEIHYTNADAVREVSTSAQHAVWHCSVLPTSDDAAKVKREQRQAEAESVRAIVEEWRAKPLPAHRTKPWSMAVLVRSRGHLTEIVAALQRDDGGGPIPFRAVEIEALNERQEVLDLAALTRALLHPADRVAWLAVLRAPWCGLGLTDLHTLAGADDPEFADRCINDLISERGDLLSDEGRERATRFWMVMRDADLRRAQLTTAEWVERTWRSLGGDSVLTGHEMANAQRYFQLLDEMEAEGQVIDQATLEERMDGLYAKAATNPGAVDLMTIHGAKGLEWDVVVVPGLERQAPMNRSRLLTWNEFDQADEGAAQVVLAPIAGKGEDSAELNKWLRGIHAAREAAERKRLFYVVCTRAREELHLFASPALNANGGVRRSQGSLLDAAWPAAEAHFAGQSAVAKAPGKLVTMPVTEELFVGDIAASDDDAAKTVTIRRLPLAFDPRSRFVVETRLGYGETGGRADMTRFERPEGSFAARSFGNAVHGFLDLMAHRLAAGASAEALLLEVEGWLPRIETVLRGDGLFPAMVKRRASEVRSALENALRDEDGRWVLSARKDAQSEYAITAWLERRQSFRLDRIFRAGEEPGAAGEDCLWIVDYKTASHGAVGLEAFLEGERQKYGAQLEAYAGAIGEGVKEVRVGLYYPMLPKLIWWKPKRG